MTDDEKPPQPGFWHRPVTRGVANGIIFAGLLMALQVQGMFQAPRPLTEESVTQHVFAGVIFGFLMYIIELWKQTRKTNAAKAARAAVENRLDREDAEKPDDDEKDDAHDRRG